VTISQQIPPPSAQGGAQNIVVPGGVYVFTKSGYQVRAIRVYHGPWSREETEWEVERVDGGSAGKRMLVRAGALVSTNL
jgi:hypothetical protein